MTTIKKNNLFSKRHIGVNSQDRSFMLESIGYDSMDKFIDAVVGNSSSGLTEAPSFKIGTINIGGRQSGRLKALSVLDCDFDKNQILHSIKTLQSKPFQKKLLTVANPYGVPGAPQKILQHIKKISLNNILKKNFYPFVFLIYF